MQRRCVWIAGLLIASGLGLRIALVLSPAFTVNSDRAIVYLIALHASRGNLSELYWGQEYGGTLIPWLAGGIMAITSDSPYVLYAVTLAMVVGAAILLCRVTVISLGWPAAVIATAVFMFPGAFLVRQTSDDGGFYISSVLFALLAIWLATEPSERLRLARVLGVGLSVGIAFWCSPMGLALAAPSLLIVLCRPHRALSAALLVPGLLAGAVLYLLGYRQWRAAGESTTLKATFLANIPDRLHALFFELIPAGLPLGTGVARLALGVLVLLLIVALIIGAFWERSGVTFGFAAGAVLLTVLFIVSGITLVIAAARYDEFFIAGISFAVALCATRVASVVPRVFARRRRTPASFRATRLRERSWPVVVLGAILVITTIAVSARGTMNIIASPAASNDHQGAEATAASLTSTNGRAMFGSDALAIDQYLESRNITATWADYWDSYRLTAASNEKVIAADLEFGRYAPYRSFAQAAIPAAIIEPAGSPEAVALAASTTLPCSEIVTGIAGSTIFLYRYPVTARQISTAIYVFPIALNDQ